MTIDNIKKKNLNEFSLIASFLIENKFKYISSMVLAFIVCFALYTYDKFNIIYKHETTYKVYLSEGFNDNIKAFDAVRYRTFAEGFRDNLIIDFDDSNIKNKINEELNCPQFEILKNRFDKFTLRFSSKEGYELMFECRDKIEKYINDLKALHSHSLVESVNNNILLLKNSIERNEEYIQDILDYSLRGKKILDPIEYIQHNLTAETIPYLERNNFFFQEKMIGYNDALNFLNEGISLKKESKFEVQKFSKNVYFIIFAFFFFLSSFLSIILRK